MRLSFVKLGSAVVLLLAAAYTAATLRGPHGPAALKRKQEEVRQLEKQNQDLAKDIEQRRQRLKRLSEGQSEQELELRRQYKLVRPDEKVFVLPPQPGKGR